jgi:hypothetical protein
LNRLTAAAQTFSVGAGTYRLTPLVLADYGEIENRILAERPDPLAGIHTRLAGLPEAQRRAELGRALDQLSAMRRVTLGELDRWWQTPDGLGYRLWLMLRREQPGISLQAAEDLLREADAARRAQIVRRMADSHGWPDPWPPPAPGCQDEAEESPLPWYRWAVELSRTYAWSPTEISRLTLAQMCIYLGWEGQSAGRRRLPLGQGAALCGRKRDQRRQWIEQMLQEIEAPGHHLDDRATQHGPGSCALPESRETRDMGRSPVDVAGHGPPSAAAGCVVKPASTTPRDFKASIPQHAGVASGTMQPAPSAAAGLRAAGPEGLASRGSLPSAGLAPLRGLAQGAATESQQLEQIRIARDQLAEQRKTNQHLQRQPALAGTVFEP